MRVDMQAPSIGDMLARTSAGMRAHYVKPTCAPLDQLGEYSGGGGQTRMEAIPARACAKCTRDQLTGRAYHIRSVRCRSALLHDRCDRKRVVWQRGSGQQSFHRLAAVAPAAGEQSGRDAIDVMRQA